MLPIEPEGFNGLLHGGCKQKIVGGNQCVMSALNTTAYIGINGDHFVIIIFLRRPSSIQESYPEALIPGPHCPSQGKWVTKSLLYGADPGASRCDGKPAFLPARKVR